MGERVDYFFNAFKMRYNAGMDHFQNIYANKARQYQRMIEAEDVDGNLLKALQGITAWEGKEVIDLGSGTGRFPVLLGGKNLQISCLDLNRPMLLENKAQRKKFRGNWGLIQGDMRHLPYKARAADIVIAGWAIGHMRSWFASDWQRQVSAVLFEMQRVSKAGGMLIVCETMSTGSLVPRPPANELAEYYAWLEARWEFTKMVIPTDYQFASAEEAVYCTQFFFGAELANEIQARGWARLPEWTGIWYHQCQMGSMG